MYTNVVSREGVTIAFLGAALNGNKVYSADVANAYLNVVCAEKIYTVTARNLVL